MLKLIFPAPKYRRYRVQKKEKKEQKMKNCVLQRKNFSILRFHELDRALVVNTDQKNRVGIREGVLAKKFFRVFVTS